jgi:transposase
VFFQSQVDAQLPHLYKYTEGYHTLYPEADQILVRSTQAGIYSLMFQPRWNVRVL